VSTLSPLNQQTLDQLHALESDSPGLTRELIRLFVADAPKQMRLIEDAYAKRDPEGVRQSAHFLRSGALVLGLTWLAERSNVLQHLALDQYGLTEADELLAQVRGELHRILLALLAQLQSG